MLVYLLSQLVAVLATAWVVRRLLGFRRGHWWRTSVAVLFGIGVSNALAQAEATDPWAVEDPILWMLLLGASVVVLSMVTAVVVEILVPPGRRRRRRVRRPIRAVRLGWGRLTRSIGVTRIAVANGLLARRDDADPGGSRLGRALARTFEDAGGIFVKLGQAMAAQPQLVTPAVAHELERLQERAAPADRASALAVIEADLGPVEEMFAKVDASPLGSASLGQTYLATLHDGRRVVVKVQRPGVDDVVGRDLDILARLARTAESRTEWAAAMGLRGIVGDFTERTREELDYRIEAANMTAAATALDDEQGVGVPLPIEGMVTRRVLVQELAAGRSVGSVGALDAIPAARRRDLADTLLGSIVRSMVAGEVFHADPHPGNVFVTGEERLVLIDWGAVGRLDPYERSGVSDILLAVRSQDAALMRQAALSIATAGDPVDEEALERQLARVMTRNITPDGRLDATLFADALATFRDFGLVLPRSTTTLFRTLATLMGTLETISPRYALAAAAGRIGGDLLASQMAGGEIKEILTREALRSAQVLRRLPSTLDSIARTTARGELRIRTSLLSEREDVEAVTRLVDRVVLAAVAAALVVASALMLASDAGPTVDDEVTYLQVFGALTMVFALTISLRVIVASLPSQRDQS